MVHLRNIVNYDPIPPRPPSLFPPLSPSLSLPASDGGSSKRVQEQRARRGKVMCARERGCARESVCVQYTDIYISVHTQPPARTHSLSHTHTFPSLIHTQPPAHTCTRTLPLSTHIDTLPLSHTMYGQRDMTTRTKTNKRVGTSPDPKVHSGIYVIYIYIYLVG